MTTANPTAKRRKSTKAVTALRVAEVLRLRLDGAALHDIRDFAGQNGWQLSDSMLKKLIGKADALLKECQERKVSRLRALTAARMTTLYARALQAADFRTALACLEAEAKLLGLYEDNRGLERQMRELVKRLDAFEGKAGGVPADERLPPAFEKLAG